MLVLSGCADDAAEGKAKPGGPASTTPSSAATETPEKTAPEEPVDDEMLRGRNVASTEVEKQVAEAWFAYWTELVRMYNTAETDRDRLAELTPRQEIKHVTSNRPWLRLANL